MGAFAYNFTGRRLSLLKDVVMLPALCMVFYGASATSNVMKLLAPTNPPSDQCTNWPCKVNPIHPIAPV